MIARLSLLRAIGSVLLAAALLAALLLFAATSRGAGVVTYTVDSLEDEAGVEACEPSEGCTLREAIQGINEEDEEGGQYRIVFSVEGTIELTEQLRLYAEEEEVEVEIEGPGAGKLTIDGGGNGRVFTARNVGLEMSGLTLTGGEESGHVDGGGGVFVVESGAVLTGVRVTGNVIGGGVGGGGIAVENGASLELVDSVVDHNVSEAEMGGGIYVESGSSATILGSTIEANEAEEDAGGGIAAEGADLYVDGSTIKDNHSAEGGGGIWLGSGEVPGVEIADSRVEGNHSDTYGGGIKAETNLVVVRSTVAGNTAGGIGGGIFAEDETTVELSTLSGNRAEGGGLGGGGIAAEGPLAIETSTVAQNEGGGLAANEPVTIRNSTVVGNSTSLGGHGAGLFGTEVSLRSSILAGNLRGGQPSDCEGTVASEGYNLLGTEAGCEWTGTTGDRVGEDPDLAPLGDYGGPTATMPPESRLSPAINHGEHPRPVDQRELTRPVPVGDTNTDIGAVEVQAPRNETSPSVAPATELDVGDTLTCEPGTWDFDTVTDATYAYSWVLDPAGSGEQVGTASTLQLDATMAGYDLVCEVTAANGVTGVTATSAAVKLDSAAVGAAPDQIDFGDWGVGHEPAPTRTVVVTATGGVPVEVTAVESSDAAVFPVEASACVGQTLLRSSCEFEVSFVPAGPSASTADIAVKTTGPDASVHVEGVGIETEFRATPPSLALATTEVGAQSAIAEVVVSNHGDGVLGIDEVLLEGADAGDFEISEETCAGAELSGSDTCAVDVVFAPTAPGARAAQLVLTGPEPGTVPLSGTAIAPGLAATPPALGFGSRAVGAGPSAPSPLVISNPGTAPTRIDSIAIQGADAADFAFAANGCIGGELAPGGQCTLSLTFDPAAAGARGAQLVVAGQLGLTVQLSGIGTEAGPAPRLRLLRGDGPLAVSGGGVARPRLECVSASGSCSGRVKLLRAPGAGAGLPAQLAGKQVRFGAGEARSVGLRLVGAAQRVLAARGRLPVVLAVDGPAGTARWSVVLRPAS